MAEKKKPREILHLTRLTYGSSIFYCLVKIFSYYGRKEDSSSLAFWGVDTLAFGFKNVM